MQKAKMGNVKELCLKLDKNDIDKSCNEIASFYNHEKPDYEY